MMTVDQISGQLKDAARGWSGMNSRADPETLAENEYAYGENVRCEDGKPQTRKGVVKPVWAHNVTEAGIVQPYSGMLGIGVYKDPEGREYKITATTAGVYRVVEGNLPKPTSVPDGVKLTGRVVFVQAFNQVYMLRGNSFRPLVMNDPEDGFEDAPEHWSDAAGYDEGDVVAHGPWVTISTLTAAGQKATATTATAHGLVTGQDVVIRGVTPADYEGRFTVTVIDPTSFYYTFAGAATDGADDGAETMEVSNQLAFWEAQIDTATDEEPGVVADTIWNQVYDVLPNSVAGVFVNNRLLLATAYTPGSTGYTADESYTKTDFLVATDALNPIRFYFTNAFRINQGSDDEIVDLIKFTDDAVVIAKGKSWFLLSGLMAGLDLGYDGLNNVTLDMRSGEYGLTSVGAITQAGTDIMMLAGPRGIVSLRQSEAGKVQALDVPLSHKVETIIKRIYWPAAATCARLAYWKNRLYAALPLDGSSENNAILVFDFMQQGWAGLDTGSALAVKEFKLGQYEGAERLYFMDTSGYWNVIEESDRGDRVADATGLQGLGWEEIEFVWRDRRRFTEAGTWLRSVAGRVVLGAWDYNLMVRLLGTEANQTRTICYAQMPDRTVYDWPWDAEDYDETNDNDDHATAGRQDYSVELGTSGLRLGSGVELDLMQEVTKQWRVNMSQPRGVQVEVTNTVGRVQMRSVDLTATRGRGRKGAV